MKVINTGSFVSYFILLEVSNILLKKPEMFSYSAIYFLKYIIIRR